jgi:hypothetical protein
MAEPILFRIGSLDIAEAISKRIGSFVFMDFIQFVAVEQDTVHCWYMNNGGEGPSFEINLRRSDDAWTMILIEHPPGTEQPAEVP